MKLPEFGVRSVIKESWRVLKTQPRYLALFLLAIIAIKAIESLVGGVFDRQGWTAASTIWGVLTTLVDMYVGVITITVSLKLIRGVKMTLAETWFTDKRAILQYFLVTIVYGFIVSIGYVLLIVPGVILQLTYSLATFIAIDKGMRVWQAMGESRRLTTGNRWKILQIGLMLVLINLGGALALGIGLLVTIPLSMIAAAVIYTHLSDEVAKEPVAKVGAAATLPPEPVEKKTEPSAADMNQYQI